MTIYEFYGAPGTGKSTTAARLYSKFSSDGTKAALITEEVKTYAERKWPICNLDHLGLLGKQSLAEMTKIKCGYDFIYTDSPCPLACFYAGYKFDKFFGDQLYYAFAEWDRRVTKTYGIKRERYFLKLKKNWFVQEGRYHTYEESLRIEKEQEAFLSYHSIEFKYW